MLNRFGWENFYKTRLSAVMPAISASWDPLTEFSFSVETAPKRSQWWVIIEYTDTAYRDLIFYHRTSGTTLYYYRQFRDLLWLGSHTREHPNQSFVQINNFAQFFDYLFYNTDDFGLIEDYWTNKVNVRWWGLYIWQWYFTISDALLTLANGTHNIVFDTSTQTITSNASWLTSTQKLLWVVVVSWSDITSITDKRANQFFFVDDEVFQFDGNWVLRFVWDSVTISQATESTEWKSRLWTLAEHGTSPTGAVLLQIKNTILTPSVTRSDDAKKVPVLNTAWYINDFIAPVYWESSEWNDNYVITSLSPITWYVKGQIYLFEADVTNTWAATLNIDDRWPKSIKRRDGSNLSTWDVTVGINEVLYDWTNFILLWLKDNYWYITKPAWEALSDWDAVRIGIDWAGEDIQQLSWPTHAVWEIGQNTTEYFKWQSFTVAEAWLLSSIAVKLSRIWSPAWVLTMKIYSDTWTTLIWTSTNTIAETWLPAWSSFSIETFNFSWILLNPWTYYFAVEFSWRSTWTAYSVMRYDSANPYTWWTWYRITNANFWTDISVDFYFDITISSTWEDSTKIYKTDASFNYAVDYIWVAKWWYAPDEQAIVNILHYEWLSWLTPWSDYYLSDTAWAISTTPWTNNVKIWKAIDENTLVIKHF